MEKSDDPVVSGNLYPATSEGFRQFLIEANRVQRDGYELVTLIRLDKAIASVFRRVRKTISDPGGFFEDV